MNLLIKRCIDVLFSFLAIIILSPILLVISVAVRVDSKGPALFRQGRLTKNGKVFTMYKFRTMIENAEQMGTGLFNYSNDFRVTRVGKFLRKSSLDELPQLFNIIKGDMSIVGPRPPVTYELGNYDTLNKKYKKRFNVKAGLTGLAQVKGRNDISWDDKVTYDNQYVDLFKKYGVLIDIKLLFDSVIKVLKKENIYENKTDESMDDIEAARHAEEEIIRYAHLTDEEMANQ